MQCNNCGNPLKLRSEFCPQCGQRVNHSMDEIIASSQDIAAHRHGDALNGKLRTAIMALLLLLAVSIGLVYLYDAKLDFDGSGLPGIPANAPFAAAATNEILEKPFVEPRPQPPIPPATVRALGYRSGKLRRDLRAANGGDKPEFDSAINRGLDFLAKTQDRKDGSWPVKLIPANVPLSSLRDETPQYEKGKVGVSSLALLAFLADGHNWVKDENGKVSTYGQVVRLGVRYLLGEQDQISGRIGPKDKRFIVYNHSMATLALAEAAALSGDAEIKAHVKAAVRFLVESQTERGGWDYEADKQSTTEDISVSAWAVQALVAAREAGVAVEPNTFKKSLAFYRSLTKDERGIYNYAPNAVTAPYSATYSGIVLMSRQLLGDGPANPEVKLLTSKVVSSIPKIKDDWGKSWNPKSKDTAERQFFEPYMMYFCSYGMFFVGDTDWKEWNRKGSDALFRMQENDGAWRTNDPYSLQGGTCFSTAMCILSLQVHHRIVHSVTPINDAE